MTSMWSAIARLMREDDAQDVIEYALIAVFIGIAGALVLSSMDTTIATTYSNWTSSSSGVPSLWDPPDPGGSGS